MTATTNYPNNVITVPADVLGPDGARASADSMMTIQLDILSTYFVKIITILFRYLQADPLQNADKMLQNHATNRRSSCFGFVTHICIHYSYVIMSVMASQITSLMTVYSTIYSGSDQRKHQSSASLAFVRGIHRWPVNYLHKGPVTQKMFPFDDIIMWSLLP